MRISYLLTISLLLVSLISCENRNQKESPVTPKLFAFEMLESSFSPGAGKIELSLPVFREGLKVHDKMNEMIARELSMFFNEHISSMPVAGSIDSLITNIQTLNHKKEPRCN